MSDHSVAFESAGGGLALRNAILLYRGSAEGYAGTAGEAFASVHDVEHDGTGRPVIAAGRPLRHKDLRHWVSLLSRSAAPELLPANVLVHHPEVLVWWVPAQVRPAYFALSNPPEGLKALAQRTTLPVPYPPHLFAATSAGLRVFALGTDERPGPDTVLLHSPVLNVFVEGKLCWGNIRRPKALGIATIPEYERAVFDSWSTHPNPGQEFTITGRGGLVRLWDDLAARRAKRFPVQRLKPFNPSVNKRGAPPRTVTLGQLVAGMGQI